MEKSMTLKQLIRRTYFKIIFQFLICICLFYLIPALFTAVDGIDADNVNSFAMFFSISSWLYLCLILIVIIVRNIQKLLTVIQNEMKSVYSQSLYFDQNDDVETLQLSEFIETSQHIEKMQEQIRKMIDNEKKQKQELMFQVSSAAHDLKTPLTVISGNAEYLQTFDLSADLNQCLSDIESSSQQLNYYFNQFIQYSKTFYKDNITKEKITLSRLTNLIDKEITPLIKEKAQLYFEMDDSEKVELYMDTRLFLRVVTNLVANAIAYSQSPLPSIVIAFQEDKGKILFSVWNDGSQFSQNMIENVGLLFYQDNESRKSSQANHFGLGLAFVKRVVEIHNWELQLLNDNDGALVTISMPS